MLPKSLELSEQGKSFKSGVYRHYKGELYHAMFVAKNSEKLEEELVIYQSLDHDYICARPLEMFLETIEVNGMLKPRFEWVKEKE